MRVLTAVRHSTEPTKYYGGLWSGNFYPALRALGHEIIESQTDLLPASRFMHIANGFTQQETEARGRITEQIIGELSVAHRKKQIDLFLCYFYNAHFDPAGFEQIKKLGIPTVNFYCNSIYQFDLVADIASRVDYSWHAEKRARDSYLRVGANPVWVQMGADPSAYHPIPNQSRESKACFIGMRYADRDRLLAELIRSDVPVDVYGSGWLKPNGNSNGNASVSESVYLGRPQTKPGTIKSYAHFAAENIRAQGIVGGFARGISQFNHKRSSAKLSPALSSCAKGFAPSIRETFARYEVNINFSNVWADGRPGSRLIPHVRLRDFEGPMCRTCYLTGHSDEIAEFYEVGKEIDTYQSAQELVDKTKYYLSHSEAAERLREAGYRRAARDHTWKERLNELFRKIGLT